MSIITNSSTAPIKTEGDLTSQLSFSQEPLPKSGDFTARAVQIVKENCEKNSLAKIGSELAALRNPISTNSITSEQIAEIVRQIKAAQPDNISAVYSQIIEGFFPTLLAQVSWLEQISFSLGSSLNLNEFDEAFRIECAKIDCQKNPGIFCMNFKKYAITHLEDRIKFAKNIKNDVIYKTIENFDLDRETLLDIFKQMENVGNYGVASASIHHFKIEDESFRFEYAKRAIQKGYTAAVASYIRNYELNEKNRIEIAKLIANVNPKALSEDFYLFSITDEEALFEIAEIAIKKDPNSAQFISSYIEQIPHRVKLFSIASGSAKNAEFFKTIFPEGEGRKWIAADYHELSFWSLKESPKDVLLRAAHFRSTVKPVLFGAFISNFKEIEKQKDPSNQAEAIDQFLLYSTALTYSGESEKLGEAFAKIVDGLKRPDQPEKHDLSRVRKEKREWLASFFLQCKTNKVSSEVLLKHMSLIEALLDIRCPVLRLELLENLMDFLSDSSAMEKYEKCLPKLQANNKKKQIKLLPLMVLAPYLSEAELSRAALLIKNEKFEDAARIKPLLSKLRILLKEPKLSRAEKIKILGTIIFVNGDKPGKKLTAKEQAEQIMTSAELVAQYLEFKEVELLKSIRGPDELREQVKTMFATKLGLSEIDKFDEKYAKTFLKMRKGNALLIHASKMRSLNEEDREEIFQLMRTVAISILNERFREMRNSIESSPHLKKLSEVAPKILALFKEPFSHDGVMLTDDPCDLLVSGKETDTCQGYDGGLDYSRCLMATLMRGETKQLVLKNNEGIILSKCTVRLLLDKDKPVLFVGDVYPWGCPQGYIDKIQAGYKALADKLGIPVLVQASEPNYPGTLTCLPGPENIQFEYVEGADITTRPPSIVQGNRGYTVSKSKILYNPKPAETMKPTS